MNALPLVPAVSDAEDLLPANAQALAQSIATVDRFMDDDDSHILTPEVGESIMLIVHELKRLRAHPASSDRDKLAREVSRTEATSFLESAVRNWRHVPRLSNDDLDDVAGALKSFLITRARQIGEEA